HLHQDGVRCLPVVSNDIHANLVERSEILGLLRGDIGLVQPPVLITTHVLGIEDMSVIELPGKVANAALLVGCHGAVVRLAQCPYPDVEHTVHWCEIPQLCSIGGDLRIRALRISKQHFPGNQRSARLVLGENGREQQSCESCDDESVLACRHKSSRLLQHHSPGPPRGETWTRELSYSFSFGR